MTFISTNSRRANKISRTNLVLLISFSLIQLLPQLLYHHSSRIPGIRDGAFSVHGTAGMQRSPEPPVSSWHDGYRDEPWTFFSLELPFRIHLLETIFLSLCSITAVMLPCAGQAQNGHSRNRLHLSYAHTLDKAPCNRACIYY